ncbi:DUF2478 domain-containing protein [Alcaligenes sp. 13f]|uniref:DUF2478 domain-containing protein n=1 Tax=Alcaligenes sp. 13f TaxID=2841924 RepID=UPI001CF6879A|nr:DUF2478 domain-containing protein [Alcaligenes sp. 13f]
MHELSHGSRTSHSQTSPYSKATSGFRNKLIRHAGKGSADALLEASEVLRQALESPADLVIVNRFGMMEADARGSTTRYGFDRPRLPDADYSGLAVELAPDRTALWNWFESSRQAASLSFILCKPQNRPNQWTSCLTKHYRAKQDSLSL